MSYRRDDLMEVNQGDDYSIVFEFTECCLPTPIVGDLHLTVVDSFGQKHKEYCTVDGTIKTDGHVALVYLTDTETWREGVYGIELRATDRGGSSSEAIKKVLRIIKRVSHGC